MKVILLTDVAKLGRKYDVKDVSSGYAQNFLFPKKLAELATKAKLANNETNQERMAGERKVQDELMMKNLESLKDVTVTVTGKANDQGHLFQGIHETEIVAALKEQAHIDINPDMIALDQPLKSVGETQVTIKAGDSEGTLTVIVDPEK